MGRLLRRLRIQFILRTAVVPRGRARGFRAAAPQITSLVELSSEQAVEEAVRTSRG